MGFCLEGRLTLETDGQHDIQKSNIQHWDHNSLFSFEEPLLDAESSLEDTLDTFKHRFLRRL